MIIENVYTFKLNFKQLIFDLPYKLYVIWIKVVNNGIVWNI